MLDYFKIGMLWSKSPFLGLTGILQFIFLLLLLLSSIIKNLQEKPNSVKLNCNQGFVGFVHKCTFSWNSWIWLLEWIITDLFLNFSDVSA